ncbi:DUF222 domain-containing protein [Cryobacterium sp. TMT2-18-2]|uniref:DUF222 domain-containing protein n=1 Tax=Cryobacterium sp. TMT2-18-2 TaxID=1259249 RepID=UPI00106D9AB7|nr:DUF222 domain-containing protein [Cryobacterium sp. TMT2-18-2]TFC29633.1 DUF222 domain-containing protein [Cryobacterium sp. TMT2-18-2]
MARAVTAGALSVDAAESIRAGLGQIDASVTAEKLAAALAALLTEASTVNADEVFKRARRMRDRLDEAGIAAREKQAHDDRYLKIYRLGEEDAGRPPQHRPDRRGLSAAAAEDRRGGRPRPGLRRSRPSVRVIVTEKALTAVPGEEPGTTEPAAHGQIEGNPVPISQETIDRLLCDTGTRGIKFDAEAQIIDVGRDERLFTEAQRTAMGVRDGGCLWGGCDRSPAWSEAHHINEWLKDTGNTNLANGVLLCHPHHLLLHNQHWKITRTGNQYWLRPPVENDPKQTLIALPSKRI